MNKHNIAKNIGIVITSFFVVVLIHTLAISIGYYALIITGIADIPSYRSTPNHLWVVDS